MKILVNKYCNLDGTKKIKDEYKKINVGFDKVEEDLVNIITSLGANLTAIKDDLAQHKLDYVDFVDEIAVRVKNLISNGNFANDTNNDGIADGFQAAGGNVTQPRIENNTQYWTPQTTTYSGSMRSSRHTFLKGHTYYVKANITNINSTYMHDHENNLVRLAIGLLDGNQTYTFTIGEETSTRITFFPRESNVECSISNVILVDLTTTFGAGKEPDDAYLDYLLNRVGAPSWFEVVNLTDFSKKPIMTARELEVYDTENELPAGNVNDVLLGLNDGIVKAVRGKNLYNPANNIEGVIIDVPAGFVQTIGTGENNPANRVSQRIKIENTGSVSISGISHYSITDFNNRVIKRRNILNNTPTTINSSDIELDTYYLWVSASRNNVNSAQVEMGSEVTSYEPYTPVKAVYANGVKLFDYPLEVSQSDDKKKELYDLAKMTLENDALAEKIMYLTNNAEYSKLATGSEPKDSQVIPLTKADEQKMIFHLHKRTKEEGFGTANDAYLPNAKNDFSDVQITSDSGEVLPYRTIFYSDKLDVIPDERLGISNGGQGIRKDSNGNLFRNKNNYLSKSSDEGKTWTQIPGLTGIVNPLLTLITKDDTLLFNKDGYLYRSEAPYDDYEQVYHLEEEFDNVQIRPKAMVQHPDGEIFMGAYQSVRSIRFYKSVDDGKTWELVADLGDVYQHVHGLYVDEYQNPPAIYAGLDGGGGVIKTTDKFETWIDLREQNPNMPQSTDFGVRYSDPSGYRLLGGETSIVGGHSIIKTVDDVNFYPVLSAGTGVHYIIKMDGVLYAGGAGTYGYRYGGIFKSEDEGETWVSIYNTGILSDSAGANDGFREMVKLDNQILVSNQSPSRLPVRILPEGSYAEVIVDVPSGTNSVKVESGHAYPNELPIFNDSDFVGEKLVHFEFNENTNVVKELVSGELYQDDFEWTKGGKHLSYFYPYITSPLNEKSALLKSLSGYLVDSSTFDTSQGVTISFWAKLSSGSRFLLFENETGDKLEIVNGYQLHLNNSNVVSFNYPIIPEPFQKHDLLISNDGSISVYTNGLLRTMSGTRGSELLNALSNGSQIEFLRNISSNDEDAIQHFVIRKGMVDEGQLLAEYNAGITDNI